MYRAGFIVRFIALVIDSFIVGLMYFGVAVLLRLYSDELVSILQKYDLATPNRDTPTLIKDLSDLISSIPALFYFSTEVFFAGTPGKKLLGLSICKSTGERASFLHLLFRLCVKNPVLGFLLFFVLCIIIGAMIAAISKPIGVSIMFFGISTLLIAIPINFIMFLGGLMIFGESKLTLHDRLTGTAVFHGQPLDKVESHSFSPKNPPLQPQSQKPNTAVDKLLFK